MHPLTRCLIAAAFAFALAPVASAQAWPAKPIRLVVNLPPGTTADLIARAVAPRLGEAGTDVDMDVVFGFYSGAGTPREIVARLNREILRIMQTAEAGATLNAIGAELVTGTAKEFAARQHSDRERFGAIVREANIRVE